MKVSIYSATGGGGSPVLGVIRRGDTIPLSLYVTSDYFWPATGIVFTLTQPSGTAAGMLSITSRSFAGSVFNDPTTGNPDSVVLKSPANRLDPTNAYDLGRSTIDKVPFTWIQGDLVEKLGITVSKSAPLGSYAIEITPGTSYVIGDAPDFIRYPIGGDVYYIAVGDTYTVTFSGEGAGGVSFSNVASCGSAAPCSFLAVPGQQVLFQAFPDTGSVFSGTTPPCNTLCNLNNVPGTMDVRFDLKAHTIRLVETGSGRGTFAGTPSDPYCYYTKFNCAITLDPPAPVEITAVPLTGSVFAGWRGPCTGTGTCKTTTDVSKTVTAVFLDPKVDPPRYAASPSSKSFGKTAVGTRKTTTVTIANLGSPGAVSNFQIAGDANSRSTAVPAWRTTRSRLRSTSPARSTCRLRRA
ncbi:MAG: hypothetical protein JSR18_14055 [Proteobacteria bacterium]|nr:hypothetical protein [Pseudomonadota bacterium]